MGGGLMRASAHAKRTRGDWRERWCVRHRDGWCATKTGKPHKESATNVYTRCGHVVILPMGSEKRVPTCVECNH